MERRALPGAALALFSLLGAATSTSIAAPVGRTDADSLQPLASAVVQASTSVPGSASLAATSQPPWNPSEPISSRRPWEQVLLFPGRIVSLPLVALGVIADKTLLYVEETAFVQRAAVFGETVSKRFGISPQLAKLGDRTGLGIRVEARAPFFGGAIRNLVTVAHSASTRHYHLTEVRALGQPMAIDYAYEWRPQERFYGIGMDATEDSLANYAAQSEHVRVRYLHGWNRDTPESDPRTEFAAWIGPRTLITRTGREPGKPSIEQYFPADVATTLNRRLEQLTYGMRFASDWRVGVPHWSSGWRVLIQAERFDRPLEWLALRSARGDGAQFTRTTLEAETGISFLRDPRTLRLMGRVVDQGITSNADRMMVADLMSLGGREGLSGFAPGRFHDVDLMLLRLSYVFPLVRRLEIELHTDAGGVFPNVWEDASWGDLEHCFGIALRGRTKSTPLGSIGVDVSRETARIRYTLGRVE
jgi:hypothetical protein